MTEQSNNENDSFDIEDKNQKRINDYWTPERLNKAIPHPLPEVTEEEKENLKKKMHSPLVTIECVEPYMPGTDLSDGTPTKADVGKRPFWNGGKLYYTKPDGKDYVASAQFCGKDNILLTAAHCIRDHKTGKWSTNVRFYRAYNDGGGQSVNVTRLTTKKAWVTGGEYDFRFDYSFLVTAAKSEKGWLGWKTGIPYSSWTAIGYPFNYDDGKYMQKVAGNKGKISGGEVEMLGNPMESGCSGGAWIGDLTASGGVGNYVIGLNSNHSTHQNEWSPFFDTGFSSLYRYVTGE